MSHAMTLGIDLGSESIGWALVRDASQNQPPEIVATGVSIFNSGRNEKGESLAQDRRMKRGQRRRRARYLWRRDRMMRALIRMNLMPQEKENRKKLERSLDPYECRAKAAKQEVTAHELGRALFHMNQRRGFLSNRKSEKKADRSAYKNGLEALKNVLGNQTLGQYLWENHNVKKDIHKKPGIRFRSVQNGSKTEYPLYPTRAMYQAEFDKIRKTQGNAQDLHPEHWEELSHIVFDQRPLREQPVGICSLYYGQDLTNPETGEVTKAPKEERSPQALPSAQMFRVVQDINHMEVRDENRRWRKLTPDEREKLWILFNTQKKIEFKAVRKKLEWPEDTDINLENDRRTYLKGNETVCTLAKYFGKDFYKKPVYEQDDVVQFILDCENADDLFNEAVTSWKLPEDKARKLVFDDEISIEDFPAGYGRFSARAYRDMIPLMRDKQLRYDEATKQLGIHHSDRGADGNANSLPYYADAIPLSVTTPKYGAPEERQKGKIANPTVHIALRQLQKVVNTLIKRHGKPHRIVIETARDLKLSKDEKDELNREHQKNLKKNEEIKKELEALGEWNGDKGEKILKWKLWEELSADINDRKCPYTLRTISKAMLCSHQVEIEHILPRSRTLDDSRANLTVSLKSANGMKKNQSPHEVFAHSEPHGWETKQGAYSYDIILSYAQGLPKNKRWRFEADAMERFKDENEWQSRFLNDTRYTTKIAKKYLQVICPNVDASTGKLTAKIRKCWGLNEILGHNKKNRDDHRQHAIDAIVLTQITRALIQKAAKANENLALEEMEIPLPEQWPTLWEDAKKAAQGITIYHRPDHGVDGPINKENPYGVLHHKELEIDKRTDKEKKNDEEAGKIRNLVIRKDIASLTFDQMNDIRDENLRRRILEAVTVDGLIPDDTKILRQKLTAFSKNTGIRRVRILNISNPIKIITHPNGEKSKHLKALIPSENHHISFWRMPDGKIEIRSASMFEARANATNPETFKPHPAAKLLMKLHKRDVVKILHNGEEKIAKIKTLSPGSKKIEHGDIHLVEHFEGGELDKRHKEDKNSGGNGIIIFIKMGRALDIHQMRKLYIDPTGKVYDPGPYIDRTKAA